MADHPVFSAGHRGVHLYAVYQYRAEQERLPEVYAHRRLRPYTEQPEKNREELKRADVDAWSQANYLYHAAGMPCSSGAVTYEYTPGFVHAKSMVCDDKFAICGTINLDYRSLVHHFECGAWMYHVDAIADIKKDFMEMLSVSVCTGAKGSAREEFLIKPGGVKGSIP